MQNHNDTIIKQTSKVFFKKICTSHFILRVWKGLLRVLLWEGVGDRTELQYIDPHSYGRQRCLSRSPDAQPEARGLNFLLSAGFLYHILSAMGLQNYSGPQLIRGSKGPFGLVWPSLPHLVYNSNSDFLSWLSYIIVQHPLNHPLNLWNGMFDRHQAEITVMQFTGHSLPVHQSMSVPWDFFCLVPFHQPNPAYAISFDYWPLGCVTSFWCITLEWHICPGRRSKYNIRLWKKLWESVFTNLIVRYISELVFSKVDMFSIFFFFFSFTCCHICFESFVFQQFIQSWYDCHNTF